MLEMKCRICGAKLKKDGDICKSCYKAYLEEEELKKDVNEQLRIKRKYSIAYEIAKYIWIFVIFILSSIICISTGGFLEELLIILIFAVTIGFLLFIDKRIAMATQVIFYEKKMVYTFKFLFFDTEKIVKYSDLKDITYYQTFRQKKFGFGDLCVYAKGIFPGATLLNGFQIKNVENVKEVLGAIGQVIGSLD